MAIPSLHAAIRGIRSCRCRVRSWTVVAGCLVAACGGGDLVLPKDGRPSAIRVVDGDGQSGSIGQPLGSPVIVEVTDAAAEPVEGVPVEFAFTSAGDGAEIVPSTATTDAGGRAQAHLLLGSKVGLQVGEARVTGATSLKAAFTALAISEGQTNHPPQAAFDSHCEALTCQFTDASSDTDGNLIGWSWSFGDGGTSTEREPVHGYSAPGTYTVTLSVSDSEGSTDDSSAQVAVSSASPPPQPPQPNQPPAADFEVHCSGLMCSFTDRSKDDDGTVVQWQWTFGDGATSSERNPVHSYGTGGRYQVLLTVTDNDGAADAKTRTAEPEAPAPPPPPPPPAPNKPPEADFEVRCSHLTCRFTDKSKDDDGSIVSWQWSFGDGTNSSQQNPVHTYANKGRYDVVLTVRDNAGATDTKDRRAEPKD